MSERVARPAAGESLPVGRPSLAERRKKNLRQLLLRAYRKIDRLVAAELVERGRHDVRVIHGTLLANLDSTGNTISVVAERASMTKQAMGALAAELEEKGYLVRVVDPTDGRARVLELTERGRLLMLETYETIDAIEARFARRLGEATMKRLRRDLDALIDS